MNERDSISVKVFEEVQRATLCLLLAKSKKLYEKQFVESHELTEERKVSVTNKELMLLDFLDMNYYGRSIKQLNAES